jgi:HSP20 family protein
MTILRWNDPFKELFSMRNKIDELLDAEVSDNFLKKEGNWAPPVDIYENEKEVVVTAELPGIDNDCVNIKVVENILSIEGEKKPMYNNKEEIIYRLECPYGRFKRVFSLSNVIDKNNIKANFKDGVLKITLPKENLSKQLKIEVMRED